jgi:hypothetical protein
LQLGSSTIHSEGFCELDVFADVVGGNAWLAALQGSYEVLKFGLEVD